jgi:hypothetical protein
MDIAFAVSQHYHPDWQDCHYFEKIPKMPLEGTLWIFLRKYCYAKGLMILYHCPSLYERQHLLFIVMCLQWTSVLKLCLRANNSTQSFIRWKILHDDIHVRFLSLAGKGRDTQTTPKKTTHKRKQWRVIRRKLRTSILPVTKTKHSIEFSSPSKKKRTIKGRHHNSLNNEEKYLHRSDSQRKTWSKSVQQWIPIWRSRTRNLSCSRITTGKSRILKILKFMPNESRDVNKRVDVRQHLQ